MPNCVFLSLAVPKHNIVGYHCWERLVFVWFLVWLYLCVCMKVLLDSLSDDIIEWADHRGRRALHASVLPPTAGCLQFILVGHSIEVNAKDNDGLTPLMLAAKKGRAQHVGKCCSGSVSDLVWHLNLLYVYGQNAACSSRNVVVTPGWTERRADSEYGVKLTESIKSIFSLLRWGLFVGFTVMCFVDMLVDAKVFLSLTLSLLLFFLACLHLSTSLRPFAFGCLSAVPFYCPVSFWHCHPSHASLCLPSHQPFCRCACLILPLSFNLLLFDCRAAVRS